MVSKRVPQEMSTDDQDSVPQVDRATARERDLVNSCDGWGGGCDHGPIIYTITDEGAYNYV